MGKKRNIIMGQLGGSTSVINSSLARVYKTVKERGFHKIYGMLHGIEGLLDEMYVNLSAQIHSNMDIELLKRASSTFSGSCRYRLSGIHENPAFYKETFVVLDRLGIEIFIYIGGNDSTDTIKKLFDYAIAKEHGRKFLGVLKTIDNDLVLVDHMPGLGSVTKYIATSIKEVIRDVMGLSYRHKTTTITKCMGGNAGWLTGSVALAKTEDRCGPDLTYLPEIPLNIERFLKECKELIQKKPSIVIAVSEEIRVPDEWYVCQPSGGSDYADTSGHKQLTGTADYLAGFLTGELGCKTRSMELSALQRSASHVASRVDINEAFMVGGATIEAANKGDTGKMVVIDRVSDDPYMGVVDIYDVHEIASNEETVLRSWTNRDGSRVAQELVSYVGSLIQGGYQSFMVSGFPRRLVLRR